jgi:hypothetical protein
MFALAALMSLITQVSGTPYIPGGDTPAGTDCSGLASWVANVASGRPAFGSRFNTGNMESALLARGFHYGTAPNSVVIGWNGGHAAVTLPDGTPVSSGESGTGVRIGGGGAYQPQFSRHMYLPVEASEMNTESPAEAPPAEAPPAEVPPAEGAPPADPLATLPPADPAAAPAPAPSPAAVIDEPGSAPGSVPADAPLPADAPAPEVPAPADGAVPAPDQVPPAEPAPAAEPGSAPEQAPVDEVIVAVPV